MVPSIFAGHPSNLQPSTSTSKVRRVLKRFLSPISPQIPEKIPKTDLETSTKEHETAQRKLTDARKKLYNKHKRRQLKVTS